MRCCALFCCGSTRLNSEMPTALRRCNSWKTAHATMARLDRTALPNTGGVPLHPAAEKAYREAGIIR